jgi:predicted restriction endonuclease
MGPGPDRPLTRVGGGKQSYFFSLSPGVGRQLLLLADLKGDTSQQELAILVNSAVETETEHETTREAMRSYRIGQEQFSRKVRHAWDDACAVTGTRVREAIRASHIKPWADCNDRQRLDHHNGLALVATLDALFDAGFISFQDDGMMISRLGSKELATLELREDMRLRHPPSTKMCNYLSYHRQYILRPSTF